MQNKYSNGKIYKLIDNTNENIYIGSTIFTLKQRLKKHISSFKRFNNGSSKNYYSRFKILNNNYFNIVLFENYPCSNFQELLIRESYYQKNIACINKNNANISDIKEYKKEYYKTNKDTINKKHKQYNETNKDKLKEYHKEYNKLYYQKKKELTLNIKIPSNTRLIINLNIEDEEYKKLEEEFEQKLN